MKSFKYIAIFGLIELTTNLQASRQVGKTAVKAGAKLVATAGISGGIGLTMTHSDRQPNFFDTTAQTTSPASSGYKPYSPLYEKYSQFNNSKSTSPSPTALNFTENKTNIANPLDNKTIAIDMNAFGTGSAPVIEASIINQEVTNQTKNSITSPQNTSNLQFPNEFNTSLYKNLGGKFKLKTPQKPMTDQLLLTYDENYVSEKSSPLLETKDIDLSVNQEITQQAQEVSGQSEQTQNSPTVKVEMPIQQTEPAQNSYDTDQAFIDTTIHQTSNTIDSWVHEYADATSNMYAQENLKNDILNSMFTKDSQGRLESINLETDIKIIEKLLEKYKTNKDVQSTLNNILIKIKQEMTSQGVTPIQANNAISYYYNPENLAIISSFMKIQPKFDPNTGAVTNAPSIEKIIETALENPTADAYKALQASLEATNIAIYASRNSNNALKTQLKSFQSSLNSALNKSAFNKFQSWGTYAASFIPSTREVLNAPGIKNITIATAVNTGKAFANGAAPYVKNLASVANLTSVGDMTLSQVAKKSGLLPADKPIEPKAASMQTNLNILKSNLKTGQEALNFDMSTKDINTIIAKNSSNKIISQSYTPAMQNDIFILVGKKPQVNSKTGAIENMPTIDDIINAATDNPSQQAFNALQSALEATRVAIYAHRNEASMLGNTAHYQQLQAFKKEITAALQNPNFTPFQTQNWTTQAKSYVASFLPSAETVLDATGLGKITVNQALNAAAQSPRIASQAISSLGLKPTADAVSLLAESATYASGIPNMTLAQAYDYMYPSTTA